MRTSPQDRATAMRPYLIGVALALVLTAIPFGLVAVRVLAPGPTIAVIAVAAVAQIVVHLRFFLRLDLKRAPQENVLTLCFTAVLIVIMVGGSLWIMFDLNMRMM